MAKKPQAISTPTEYSLVTSPKGYFNKREITNQDPAALVVGSKNMIINDADKVVSRNGYTLDGQAKTVTRKISSKYDFISKNGKKILRSYLGATVGTGKLQVRTEYTPGTILYHDLLTLLTVADFQYTTWWNDSEAVRVLVFVDGTTSVRMWGGGLAYIASNTDATITKTGVMTTSATISFVASSKKILDSASGFITAGWVAGDVVIVSGSASNNQYFTIQSVTAGELTLVSTSVVVDESAGPSITLKKEGTKTWAEEGFFINVVGRTVTIPGYGTYTYSGGETSLTLTGLSAVSPTTGVVPAITAGTPVFQGVITVTSLTGVSPAITPNLIMTKDNQVWYGDTETSTIYGSKNTAYNDCAFTTPLRVPGEGFKITLDNFTIGFTQDEDNVYVFAGTDDLYKITFELNAAQSGESIKTKKLRAGGGQAAISQNAIIPVKNGIMYITNEKTLTWLTSIENVFTPQSLPISDPIKDDFDSFDFTGASGTFFENAIWLAIPAENLVYIYDFDKALWHTPQTIPVMGFSVIKNTTTNMNELFGHSNSVNETYKLNSGLDDNGVIIEFVAAFSYRQFGNRSILHCFEEYYNELYMSVSTVVACTHNYEYQGAEFVAVKSISGSDIGLQFAFTADANLGKDNLGKNPLGSTSVPSETLNKYRCIHEMKKVDFFEHQVIYSSDSQNAQFEILSHGPNIANSTNIPKSIKR
jgi:hypothetical protein